MYIKPLFSAILFAIYRTNALFLSPAIIKWQSLTMKLPQKQNPQQQPETKIKTQKPPSSKKRVAKEPTILKNYWPNLKYEIIELKNDESNTKNLMMLLKEALLSKEFNVNTQDANGRTLLSYAAEYAKPKLVKALIDGKADVTIADTQGITPLMIAASKNNLKVALEILSTPINLRIKDIKGRTVADHAELSKNKEMIELIAKEQDTEIAGNSIDNIS
jgi:ankyrin repeat protein